MDDQTLDPIMSQNSSSPADDTQQVVQPVVQQPVAPIGGMNKEAGPAVVIEQPVAEVLTPSEAEPILSPEVKEAGVEVSPNTQVPDLTVHDKKAGLSHAPVIAPIPTEPSEVIHAAITQQQAIDTLKKNKNTRNSITWLAESFLRQVKMIHGKIKGEH